MVERVGLPIQVLMVKKPVCDGHMNVREDLMCRSPGILSAMELALQLGKQLIPSLCVEEASQNCSYLR
jgi:hypothetical protein